MATEIKRGGENKTKCGENKMGKTNVENGYPHEEDEEEEEP